MKKLQFLACLLLVGPAEAQVRPFVFTVPTSPSGAAAGPDTRPWTAYYDAGYGERTAEPFGYDGVEQRFGVQGHLGAGFTLLGHVGLGIGGDATRSSQQAELLKDVLSSTSGVRLGVEAVGEDLEGFWEAEEARGRSEALRGSCDALGGASLGRLWVSVGGGPIVYATRSGRSSPAPRPLDAAGNGFTMRVSVGYTF